MTTILLSTLGTAGDVNPFLALARALRRQDVRPVLLVNPGIRSRVEQAGLEARWVGEPVKASRLIVENPKYMGLRGGEHVLREVFVPYTPPLHEETRKAIQEEHASVVVSHVGCFGSAWAARESGLPSVIVHLAPASVFSRESLHVYSKPVRTLFRAFLHLGPRIVNRWLKTVCRTTGTRWQKNLLLETTQQPDLLLGLWSPLFRSPSPDDWQKTVICGFPADDDTDEPLSPQLAGFLEKGEPPIAFGLGSSAVHVAGDFYVQAARACQVLERRGLLLCGDAVPGGLPESVLAVPYASYSQAFPRCAAIVHHGGIGTTAKSLQAGRPSVVVPFAHDQFDNAARLKVLGISHTIFRKRFGGKKLVKVLQRVLSHDMRTRASALGERIRTEGDGAQRAAKEILTLHRSMRGDS